MKITLPLLLTLVNLFYCSELFAINPEENKIQTNNNNFINTVLKDGEELTFKIRYGIVCCVTGKAVTSRTDHTFNNRPSMRIEVQAFTTNLVDVFTTINNYYQSYVDKETFLPYYFSESVHENSFKRNRYTLFDRNSNEAVTDSNTYKINESTFDFLSLFFFVRAMNFDNYKEGDIVRELEYFYYKDPSKIKIMYLGKEKINSNVGNDIECIKISPIFPDEDVFTQKAKTILWISNDERRLPIKMQTAISWGVVNVDLIQVRNIQKQ